MKSLYNLHCKDIHSSGWIKYINTIFQNNGMSYIWATQDFNVDSNNHGRPTPVYKCECDQFKQLWHSRITCDAIRAAKLRLLNFLSLFRDLQKPTRFGGGGGST